jgi:tetratricopeptide (TPR) repeat protein
MAESALGQSPPEYEPSPEWWQVWIASQMSPIEYFHIKLIQKRGLQNLLELVEKVRPIVEQYGTTIQRARFFMALTILVVTRDRFVVSEETLAYARISHELILTTNDLNQIAWGHYQLGYTLAWHGDIDTAEEELRVSLLLAERTQDPFLQVRCLNACSSLYRGRGQVEKSRQYSLRAMALATETQRPEAIGAAKANLGWAAWREGNLTEAQEYCLAALEIWRLSFHEFNFQWLALFPLLAVTLAQDRLEEAMPFALALLDPQQQRLPDGLTTALEAAIQAWDADQRDVARLSLEQAIALAQQTTYL